MPEDINDDVPARHIGTFHKSGTALFESILRTAQGRNLLTFWPMHQKAPKPDAWDVAFDFHSVSFFDNFQPDANQARYVICVRDPRDMIISAAYYHMKSREEWLKLPREALNGMTYQEKINSLPDMQSRFRFEISPRGCSNWEINKMLRIPFGSPSLYVTRLETLVTDYDLEEFRRIFKFLLFPADVQEKLVQIAHDNSLFSGKVKNTKHVRSGKAAQYLTEFDEETKELYETTFGDAAERLGYPS